MPKGDLLRLPLDIVVWALALYSLSAILRPFFGSLFYYLLILSGIVAAFLFIIYRFRRPPIHRIYNLKPLNKELVCTRIDTKLLVDPTGSKVETTIHYVFLQQPSKSSLYDLLEPSSMGPKVHYTSNDAVETLRESEKRGGVVIYWQPKKQIHPYEEYHHKYEAWPLGKYDDDMNGWFYNSTRLTGRIVIEIDTYRPVLDSYCLVTRRHLSHDHEKLLRLAVFPTRNSQKSSKLEFAQSKISAEVIDPDPAEGCWVLWSHGSTLRNQWRKLAEEKFNKLQASKVRKYFSRDYYHLKGLLLTLP